MGAPDTLRLGPTCRREAGPRPSWARRSGREFARGGKNTDRPRVSPSLAWGVYKGAMKREKTDAAGIVDRLETEYRKTVEALRVALKEFLAGGPPPDPAMRQAGAFCYPELRLNWPAGQAFPRIGRAYARIGATGRHVIPEPR